MRARFQRILCRVGLHGYYGGQGSKLYDTLTWCLDCGRTWEPTYDGLHAGQRRRRDLSFGREAVTEPNPTLERLLIEATRDELEVVLRGIIAAEPHLVYPVIGALEK